MQIPDKVPFTVRVNVETKRKADEVADQLGITLTAAINMFVEQFARDGEMPFQPTTHAKILREQDLDAEFVALLRQRLYATESGQVVSKEELVQNLADKSAQYEQVSHQE